MKTAFAYTGIGSRQTPEPILKQMKQAAMVLANWGLTLRSGGDYGADTAFEAGCSMGSKEIFIPWGGFLDRSIHEDGVIGKEMRLYHVAEMIAREHYPAWDNLTPVIKSIMTRNSYQVLGPTLDRPSLFVLCWTPEGKGGDGTDQTLRLAASFGIPVFDMANMELETIQKHIVDVVESAADKFKA